jgi:hypothetical protein
MVLQCINGVSSNPVEGRTKNLTALKSNSNTVWFNFQTYIYIVQANKMTFIKHGFRVSVVSDVRERVRDLGSPLHLMLRRSSLVECVSVLHGTCLQCVEIVYPSVCAAILVKKILSTHFLT